MNPAKQMVMVMFSVVALSLFAINLEPTITGQVITSKTCGELGCYETCDIDSECDSSEQCCPAKEEGVCFDTGKCSYVTEMFEKETKQNTQESPQEIKNNTDNINLTELFLTLTIVLGLVYAVKHH